MTLSEAAASNVSIRLICQSCGTHQPAYPHVMMEKHPPETDLQVALLLWRCMFCDEIGQFRTVVMDANQD